MLSKRKDCISSSREGNCSHLPPSCERRAQWCCLDSGVSSPGWLLVVNRFHSSSQCMLYCRDVELLYTPGGQKMEGLLLHLSEGSCCLLIAQGRGDIWYSRPHKLPVTLCIIIFIRSKTHTKAFQPAGKDELLTVALLIETSQRSSLACSLACIKEYQTDRSGTYETCPI